MLPKNSEVSIVATCEAKTDFLLIEIFQRLFNPNKMATWKRVAICYLSALAAPSVDFTMRASLWNIMIEPILKTVNTSKSALIA